MARRTWALLEIGGLVQQARSLKPLSSELLLTRCQPAHMESTVSVRELLNHECRAWILGMQSAQLDQNAALAGISALLRPTPPWANGKLATSQ